MTLGDRYLIVAMTCLIIASVYSAAEDNYYWIFWIVASLYFTYKRIKADRSKE